MWWNNKNSWDDTQFRYALKAYLDIRKNVDPKKELKRRAKNVGMRLIKIYKEKGVVLSEITAKVKSLGFRVKIRPKLRQLFQISKLQRKLARLQGVKGTRAMTMQQLIGKETRARRSAKGFTTTGWFPAVEKLGGNPKRQVRAGTGPRRGKLIEKLSGNNISEALVNQQPGAGTVMDKTAAPVQQVLDDEAKDMMDYVIRKQQEAAKKAGLTP